MRLATLAPAIAASVGAQAVQNVVVGVTAGFTMILTAVAIAGGLLVASVLVPTTRR